MNSSRDPLQEALNSKKSSSFYSVPSSHGNFFKTNKYDIEHLGLSFSQRILCFCLSMFVGALMFFYSCTKLLTAIIYPAEFVIPYALSNIIFFFMFGFLSGFSSHIKGLFRRNKQRYTIAFIASTIISLYTALYVKSRILLFIAMITQVVSFSCFAITFVPGGSSGLTTLFGLLLRK